MTKMPASAWAVVGALMLAGAAADALAAPAPFSKLGPSNGATGVSTTPTVHWEASAGADHYVVCANVVDDSCPGSWVSVGDVTSITWPGPALEFGTTYYWQVRAVDGAGAYTAADDRTWWHFTTRVAPPAAFGKTTPTDGATGQATSLTLTWAASTRATSYEYCYDTTNDSACSGWTSAGTNTSVGLSGLGSGTTYYWHVRAVGAGGTTYADSNAWWSFTTQPGPFSKLTPANGATAVSATPTVHWQASEGATSYEVCANLSASCATSWVSVGNVTSVTWPGPPLAPDTTYYWQVRAVRAGGYTAADNQAWWHFTTQVAPPGAFGKTTPANQGTTHSASVTLTWGSSARAASYEYCYDTTGDGACAGTWTSTGTNRSVGLSGLSDATTYYWQVRALNPAGTAYADHPNTWWSFTTQLAAPGWTSTAAMASARRGHTATLLANGKVLVTGGEAGWPPAPLSTAELYDPTTGTWTTTSPMATARAGHTATLLPSGKVLVAGGYRYDTFEFLSSAEIYDPALGTWTTALSMTTRRKGHTATRLANGKVLVAGGFWFDNVGHFGFLASVEVYDPAVGTWTTVSPMAADRYSHTATLLSSGSVLVAGGFYQSGSYELPMAAAELYDPFLNTWAAASPLAAARGGHTATLLWDGRVLVAGGHDYSSSLASTELFDPDGGTWTATSAMTTVRHGHTATLLPDGDVLVAGGADHAAWDAVTASAEVYYFATRTWATAAPMTTPRVEHTATLLPNGRVLATGGINNDESAWDQASAELYANPLPATPIITWPTPAAIVHGTPLGATQLDATASVPGTLVYDPPAGTILAVGAQTLSATFTPTDTMNFTSATGTVTLTVNPATRVIGLSGPLTFGAVTVGTTATATLTIANTGNSPLTVTGISYPAGFSGAWSGTVAPGGTQGVTVAFAPPAAGQFSGTVAVDSDRTSGANTIAASGTGAPAVRQSDFDGDGVVDVAVYRPSAGTWFSLDSSAGNTTYRYRGWGSQASGDVPVVGDFDGDGRLDPTVFRPASGTWFILESHASFTTWSWFGWGTSTDVLMPGDYDGDGKTDAAVYRPATGTWYIRPSNGAATWSVVFDQAGDVPLAGDFDGDGRRDPAVYRASSGTWFWLKSTTNRTTFDYHGLGVQAQGDVPSPGDYDGDGKTDLCVYRPASGTWFILESRSGWTTWSWCGWGTSTDTVMPADFDGDGKTDPAVYRASTGEWFVRPSSGATPWRVVFGRVGDIPLRGNR